MERSTVFIGLSKKKKNGQYRARSTQDTKVSQQRIFTRLNNSGKKLM